MSDNSQTMKGVRDNVERARANAAGGARPLTASCTAMPRAVERAGYRGCTGVETYVGDITETWEEYRLVPDEFRDLGERVLMLGRIEVRGKGSGTPVDSP